MGTIRFILRDDKTNNKGEAPIQMVYQLSGQRKYYQTRLKLLPSNWDATNQAAKYLDKKSAKAIDPTSDYNLFLSSKDVEELNNTLSTYKSEINNIENRFILNKEPFSVSMVLDAFKKSNAIHTKIEAPTNQLFEFLDNYINDNKTTREPGSLAVYRSLKTHLDHYQQDKKRKVTFDTIDYSFFQDFQNYLIEKRGLNNTTVAKQLSTVKTFLNYARVRGILVSTNYKEFKIKKMPLEVIALTNEEFETLYKMDLSYSKRLDQVRDIFCFACATGLRYSDLEQLKWEHIKGDAIKITVKKTKEALTIPLNPFSFAILDKYKDNSRPLPMISNQKLNLYLKGGVTKDKGKIMGLCQLAGINEPIEIVRFRGTKREAIIYPKYELIGVHSGRKTFVTLSLEKGMSAEEVMGCTGHKDYKSFSRYVKITEQRKKVVMSKAWGKVELSKKLKAI